MSFFSELNRRNVLRVAAAYLVSAWLLIQIAETIFPLFGLDDAARLVVVVLAIGFVPALVFAWAFELTPEGFKRDRDVSLGERRSQTSNKQLDRIIIVVLGLAVALFAFERFVLVPARTASEVEAARQQGRSEAFEESFGDLSLAVLPFDDLSPSADQAYLANGIAAEILNQLAAIPELRVIARSSAFALKDSGLTAKEVAKRLAVVHVLEGTVGRAADRIRISVQLIDGASETQIWQNSYDTTLDDVISVQDEVAAAVVRELEPRLTGRLPASSRVGTLAYSQYLKAQFLIEEGRGEEALALLEQIVAAEPSFADAWALLASTYVRRAPTFGLSDHAGDVVWAKGQQAIGKVSEIDAEHPIVLLNSAYLGIESSADYRTAARYIERAVETNTQPALVLRPAASFALMIGEPEWAVRLLDLAQRRDPLCSTCVYLYGRALMQAGHYEQVESTLREWLKLGSSGGELTIGTARLLSGDIDGAEAVFERRPDIPGRKYGELLVRLARGERGLDDEISNFAALDSYLNSRAPAELYAQAGNEDAAFAWFARSAQEKARWQVAYELRSPLLEPLHGDPRWLAALEAAGIAPHQLAGVNFDPQITWADTGN